MDSSQIEALNSALHKEGSYTSASPRLVSVMLLFWKDGDLIIFRQQAQQLRDLFQDFNYKSITEVQIPSTDSENSLQETIKQKLQVEKDPRSVIIIHYGGHALRNLSGDRKAIWSSTSKPGGSTLRWYDIQPLFSSFKGQVLLLLDCCFAGQAMRGAENTDHLIYEMISPDSRGSGAVVPQNLEVFAACNFGETTPAVNNSFTEALIHVLKMELKHEGDSVKVATVAKKMLEAKTVLLCQPLYMPLEEDYRRSIYFEHYPSLESFVLKRMALTSLDLTLSFAVADIDEETFQNMLTWLQSHPPTIMGVECKGIYPYTRACREYVEQQRKAGSPDTGVMSIPPERKAKTNGAWQSFVGRLVDFWAWSQKQTVQEITDCLEPKVTQQDQEEMILKELEDAWRTLQQTIERNVLSRPDLDTDDLLRHALNSPVLKDLGLSDILTIRWFAKHPASSTSLEIQPSQLEVSQPSDPSLGITAIPRPGGQLVLVEYKYYDDEHMNENLRQTYTGRIQSLAAAIKKASNEEENILRGLSSNQFYTLRCIHWFVDLPSKRYGLEFEFPGQQNARPVTLHQLLSSRNGALRPDLGQRLSICKKMGQSVLAWHSAGWVHQGISSHNVVFFHPPGELSKVDFSNPYLCGFLLARESEDKSLTWSSNKDLGREVYRHRDRQGNSVKQFKPKHDIYSFGVLLMDLGNWDPVEKSFSPGKSYTPIAMYERIVKSIHRLKFYVGAEFAEAVRRCIELDLNIGGTDAELRASFENLVLAKIHDGTGI